MKFILASSSPRRKDLLASLDITPDQIISPDVDETPLKGENPRDYVKRIAGLKAQAVHAQVKEAYVLAADTILEKNRKIILKPENKDEARRMLLSYSGKRHRALTGVCVMAPDGRTSCSVVTTRLSFKRLMPQEVESYLLSGEWEGKAGAYDIRGKAAKFIKFLSGSYTNVIGLPLYETEALIRGLGFPSHD